MKSFFEYCPKCGSSNHTFENNHKFNCLNCGFEYYHNMAAAVMCIIKRGNKYLFTIRNNEPQKGKLDFPGGFVDPWESAQEAAIRELREELGLELEFSDLEMIDSFPNHYVFKEIPYQTLDVIFRINLAEKVELKINDDEIKDFLWLSKEEVDEDRIGFDSMRKVVEKYVLD